MESSRREVFVRVCWVSAFIALYRNPRDHYQHQHRHPKVHKNRETIVENRQKVRKSEYKKKGIGMKSERTKNKTLPILLLISSSLPPFSSLPSFPPSIKDPKTSRATPTPLKLSGNSSSRGLNAGSSGSYSKRCLGFVRWDLDWWMEEREERTEAWWEL